VRLAFINAVDELRRTRNQFPCLTDYLSHPKYLVKMQDAAKLYGDGVAVLLRL
jgi:hypothetical protein